MKKYFFALFMMGTVSIQATAATVFSCNAKMVIDVNESTEIGIQVLEESGQLLAFYTGAAENGPVATTKQRLTLKESLEVNAVAQLLAVTKLPQTIVNKIASVEIYTAGNFDDDAAGVRTAEFFAQDGASMAKAMFFGWAGALVCE